MTINIDPNSKITFTKKDGLILNSKKPGGSPDPSLLPLATLTDFTSKFVGVFRYNANYGRGVIAIKSNGVGVAPTMFASGANGVDGQVDSGYNVAEFAVPEILQTTLDDVSTVPFAETIQSFTGSLVNRAPDKGGWPNNPDELQMTSMHFYDGKLLVNGAIYYDGNGENTTTSLIVDDASDLANSNITGQFGIQGAQHLTGWLVPTFEWAATLGSEYLMGSGQSLAIVSRQSAGPSLFSVDRDAIFAASAGDIVPSTAHLDYSLSNPLKDDRLNFGGTKKGRDLGLSNNGLMTSKCNHTFGIVVPEKRSYLVIGRGAGITPLPDSDDFNWHGSKTDFADKNGTLYYKGNVNAAGVAWTSTDPAPADYVRIANKAGSDGAAGYETYDGADTGTQYLLYDLDEIAKASETYDPVPYESGYMADIFPRAGQTGIPSGGENPPFSPTWDEPNKRLYLSLPYTDYHPGANGQTYSKQPLIAVYDFS
ncbi:MAG: hypothetical protein JKY93_01685 [Gammaproteobacteria bacterium]|nr:hypothetical protein [Gammaproteobacteria bacterium]